MAREHRCMDEYIAFFPYTKAAVRYVEKSTRTFASLLRPGEFSSKVLQRSVERITWAIIGEIDQKEDKPSYLEAELFSYVMARVIVSCISAPRLIQKYAAAEARYATHLLCHTQNQSQLDYIHRLLDDFEIDASVENNAFHLYFADVIRYTARLKGSGWRLVNLMNRGHVVLAKNELVQLLAEIVRLKVLDGLPLKLETSKCEELVRYVTPLKEIVAASLSDDISCGTVHLEACPPCIKALLLMASAGRNLTHPARFALTSFLANIGMNADDIVRIYESSPDFSEDLTTYQVGHIMGSSGKDYTPPGCSTMETYGNCVESDSLCKRISHPLSYYRIKTKRPKRTAHHHD